MLLVITQYDCFKQFYRENIVKIHSKMSQFAAPDNLHIYPILVDKPNAKNQSVFPVHWWTEKFEKA